MTDDLDQRKTHWRDTIEAIVAAIVLALLLKAFILEAYRIPTGSMQPTLMGLETPTVEVKDRIVVDKLTYALRDPERFEVAVFRYPLDRSKNFVKRIVGMPNEELRVLNGDVWVRKGPEDAWEIPRRPEAVMREHWKELDDVWTGEVGPVVASKVSASSSENATVRFGLADEPIIDEFYDGYPKAIVERLAMNPGGPPVPLHARTRRRVGDLRFEGILRANDATVEITVVLTEGPRTYLFRVPGPASAPDARPRVDVETDVNAGVPNDGAPLEQTQAVASAPFRLAAGKGVRIAAQNLDDRLRLEIDGQEPIELDVLPVANQDARVKVRFVGGGAMEDVTVSRDIFYIDRGMTHWTLGDGQYVMLGDDTQDSSDGREWELDRYRLEDGTILRGNHRERENPVPLGSRDRLFFVDEWGRRHWLALDAPADLPAGYERAQAMPREPAPLVDRELITGRALAVFWPIRPLSGIVRLEWVH
ncbi:MAG: signal peptidase I [Planctomycetota bacterium]